MSAQQIRHVYVYMDGMVAVCDARGHQLPEYQGTKHEKWEKILRAAPRDAEFHGVRREHPTPTRRDFQEFAHEVIRLACWDGMEIDGGTVQDMAVKAGILTHCGNNCEVYRLGKCECDAPNGGFVFATGREEE